MDDHSTRGLPRDNNRTNRFLYQVQEQATERRRADRKEKRELDKEKAKAEYRARDLEGQITI